MKPNLASSGLSYPFLACCVPLERLKTCHTRYLLAGSDAGILLRSRTTAGRSLCITRPALRLDLCQSILSRRFTINDSVADATFPGAYIPAAFVTVVSQYYTYTLIHPKSVQSLTSLPPIQLICISSISYLIIIYFGHTV